MDTQTLLIIILIGVAAGTLGGLVGIGGGIIIVPALIYFLGMNQLQAQGTSFAMILFPVGILGVIQYHKQGYINYPVVLWLALGFVIGGYFGSKIATGLPQATVKKIFAILMIIMACKMLFLDKNKKTIPTTPVTDTKS